MTKQTVLLIFLAFWLCLPIAHAQQLALFAQHPEYHGLINAASVNSNFLTDKQNVSFGVSYRSQFDDLIKNKVVRSEWIGTKNTFIVGAYIQQDEIGITQNTDAYVRGAYILPFGDVYNSGISLGFNVGYTGRQIRTGHITPSSISLMFDDKINPDGQQGFWDAGLGLYAYKRLGKTTEGQYIYGGVSMPRIKGQNADSQKLRHIYSLIGVNWAINNDHVVDVSTWTRSVKNLPWQWSVNGRYHYLLRCTALEALWLGGGMVAGPKNAPAFMTEMGFTFRSLGGLLKLGYGYTFANVFSQKELGNAHEFNLSFTRQCAKKQKDN